MQISWWGILLPEYKHNLTNWAEQYSHVIYGPIMQVNQKWIQIIKVIHHVNEDYRGVHKNQQYYVRHAQWFLHGLKLNIGMQCWHNNIIIWQGIYKIQIQSDLKRYYTTLSRLRPSIMDVRLFKKNICNEKDKMKIWSHNAINWFFYFQNNLHYDWLE